MSNRDWRLFHLSPVVRPEQVIPHLAGRDVHWKAGRSAREIAERWVGAGGIPDAVRTVLDLCPDYRDACLIEGFFERVVGMPGRGAGSHTDLMALVHTAGGHAVIAVEGKVDEPFGPSVRQWRDGSANRELRLGGVCSTLGLEIGSVAELRYQLLHRAASAVLEARRYHARQAMVLIHSFDERDTGFDEYAALATALGSVGAHPGRVSDARMTHGVELRLGWARDRPLRMAG